MDVATDTVDAIDVDRVRTTRKRIPEYIVRSSSRSVYVKSSHASCTTAKKVILVSATATVPNNSVELSWVEFDVTDR